MTEASNNAAMTSTSGNSATLLQRPTLGRQWLVKVVAFAVLLVGFGLWGTLDLAWLYPRRGLADASLQFKNFAEALDKAGRLSNTSLAVTDPPAILAQLAAKEQQLRDTAKLDDSPGRVAAAELAKLAWLQSLQRTWQLNTKPKPLGELVPVDAAGGAPGSGSAQSARHVDLDPAKGEAFTINSSGTRTPLPAQALLAELVQHWKTTAPSTPLSGFDMPVQVIFILIGFIGGLWALMTILRARATCAAISWQPSEQRLTLPSGESLVPSDLADVDKRLWHKFFVTLNTTNGKNHKLDLYRYEPLEAWVLEMEKTQFPDRAQKPEPADPKEPSEKPAGSSV